LAFISQRNDREIELIGQELDWLAG